MYDILTFLGDLGGVFGSNFALATMLYALVVGPNADSIQQTESFLIADKSNHNEDSFDVTKWFTGVRKKSKKPGGFFI